MSAGYVKPEGVGSAALKTEAAAAKALKPLTKEYGKLVITVALTGNVMTKSRNASVPCSAEEIADDVERCFKAGAQVFHLHARDEDEKPTQRLDVIIENVRLIKKRCPDAIIQISTGGRAGIGKSRIMPMNLLPEMGSFTTGTVNMNPIVYENSPQLIEDLAKKFKETGVKPAVEIFDHSMITNAKVLVKKGLLTPPLHYGFVMGAPGAQDGQLQNLAFLVNSLPEGSTWDTIGIGKFSIPLAVTAIANGGHVRVGLEDNNRMPDGSLATNEGLVKVITELAATLGREIATPDEARALLSLPLEYKDRILAQCDKPLAELAEETEPAAKKAKIT